MKGGRIMSGTEINKSLLSGSNSLLLLQLLSEKEMYGYEMIEVLGSDP